MDHAIAIPRIFVPVRMFGLWPAPSTRTVHVHGYRGQIHPVILCHAAFGGKHRQGGQAAKHLWPRAPAASGANASHKERRGALGIWGGGFSLKVLLRVYTRPRSPIQPFA